MSKGGGWSCSGRASGFAPLFQSVGNAAESCRPQRRSPSSRPPSSWGLPSSLRRKAARSHSGASAQAVAQRPIAGRVVVGIAPEPSRTDRVTCPLLLALPQKLAIDPENSVPAGLATALPHHCYAAMGAHSGPIAQRSRWRPPPASRDGASTGAARKGVMPKMSLAGC
jgi:hypothetical protein